MIWLLFACFLSKSGVEAGVESDFIDSASKEVYPVFENCENMISNTACDFQGINSLNEVENLYDFYQNPIVLDFSTMWCGPCNRAGAEVQDLYKMYEGDDLIYLTILIENNEGFPPTPDDLKWWLEEWGIIESPVLGLDRSIINNEDQTQGWFLQGWPTFYFIDDEMVVQGYMRGYSRDAVIAGIEGLIDKE